MRGVTVYPGSWSDEETRLNVQWGSGKQSGYGFNLEDGHELLDTTPPLFDPLPPLFDSLRLNRYQKVLPSAQPRQPCGQPRANLPTSPPNFMI